MEEREETVAIVDAYSSGNLLAPEFKSRRMTCIHIQSELNVPLAAKSSFHCDDFAANIIHDGEIEKTLRSCRRYPLRCVIAGSETGVELADRLSEALSLNSNGSALSRARRDKFKMVSQVRNSGLFTIPSLKTNDFDEALAWVEGVAGWPVVVKPLRSAGTDSVTTCSSMEELRFVLRATLGKCDQFGSLISNVIIQKKVKGREYIVDMVSSNGNHHVTNIWLIVKGSHNGGDFVCEYDQLLTYQEGQQNKLVEYAVAVVTALGIEHGPSHTELMLTAEGPVLIETASRLHGAGFPIYSRECVGYSQVDLTADAYVDPLAFEAKTRTPYQLSKNLVIVELISRVEGKLRAVSTKQIETLTSFYSMKLNVEPGGLIEKTVDVFTCPGHVVLMHQDLELIWHDYNYLRNLESKDNIYVV